LFEAISPNKLATARIQTRLRTMAKAAVSMLCLAASSGAAAAAVEAKPLITTDLIYGTYDLVYDCYSTAWAKADVDGLLAKIPMDDVKKVVSQQMAQLPPVPPEVTQAIAEAQTKSVQLKALAAEYVDKAYEPANEMAVAAITKLETQLPAMKGMIPKTVGNLALFVVYMGLVLYTLLKVFLFALRTVKCVLCCFCCCSLCRRRGGSAAAAEKNGKAKAAAKGKAATTATNGTTNGKATTAKAKAKK